MVIMRRLEVGGWDKGVENRPGMQCSSMFGPAVAEYGGCLGFGCCWVYQWQREGWETGRLSRTYLGLTLEAVLGGERLELLCGRAVYVYGADVKCRIRRHVVWAGSGGDLLAR